MKLSVIVPVYNEQDTIGSMMDKLCSLKIPIEMEIIVVHSWSKDGTGLILERYRDRSKIITQTYPMGKGNAVRRGLLEATGDIILIQDADLEYNIEDYRKLIAPIVSGHTSFVLGSRHTSNGVVRQFDSNPVMASIMNFGHRVFAFLVNKLFGSDIKDPFTMFKVFRAECIKGAKFRCDRFDFDFELVITMLKRGYIPIEIPVSYKSRCFKEGKKVNIWWDPWLWLWVIIRMKLTK